VAKVTERKDAAQRAITALTGELIAHIEHLLLPPAWQGPRDFIDESSAKEQGRQLAEAMTSEFRRKLAEVEGKCEMIVYELCVFAQEVGAMAATTDLNDLLSTHLAPLGQATLQAFAGLLRDGATWHPHPSRRREDVVPAATAAVKSVQVDVTKQEAVLKPAVYATETVAGDGGNGGGSTVDLVGLGASAGMAAGGPIGAFIGACMGGIFGGSQRSSQVQQFTRQVEREPAKIDYVDKVVKESRYRLEPETVLSAVKASLTAATGAFGGAMGQLLRSAVDDITAHLTAAKGARRRRGCREAGAAQRGGGGIARCVWACVPRPGGRHLMRRVRGPLLKLGSLCS
jgi:hypothetical protein